MRHRLLALGLFIFLISCKQRVAPLNPNLIKNINPTTSFDSTLNFNGNEINEYDYILMFIKSDLNKENAENYNIDTELKWGIYISNLIDLSKYETSFKVTNLIIPEKFKTLKGGIKIPIYSDTLNPYFVLALLKAYDFIYGLNVQDCIEMYSENKIIFTFSKDVTALDLFEIEFLFKNLMSENLSKENRLKYYNGLQILKRKYPFYKRFEIIFPIVNFEINSKKNDAITALKKSEKYNYQYEYLIQNFLTLSFKKKSIEPTFQKELLDTYDSNFSYCNINYLRFYNGVFPDVNKYKFQCQKCLNSRRYDDSSKSLVYLALLYMHEKNLKALDSIINISNYEFNKHKKIYYESEEKKRESGMYNILLLRSLLYQNKIGDYVKKFKLFSGKNILMKLDFDNFENFKAVTRKFYLLDREHNTTKFEKYFENSVFPYYHESN